MKVTYIGDDKSPPEVICFRGITFKINEEVEVKDRKILFKLKKLKTFRVGTKEHKKEVVKEVIDVDGLSDEELKNIIVNNNLILKDRKKSTAIEAVKSFLKV